MNLSKYAVALATTSVIILSSIGMAATTSLNLANYTMTDRYDLPTLAAAEASAITFNWDTGTLFVIGDEGETLVEISKSGARLSSMSLGGFDDTEGLTYIGNNQFVIVEERLQAVYRVNYVPLGTSLRGQSPGVQISPLTGNIGLEGASYERSTGDYFMVKEVNPQAAYKASIEFPSYPSSSGLAAGTKELLFTPAFNTNDVSDIQVLSNAAFLAGHPAAQNLLIISQEGKSLFEVTRSGDIVSSIALPFRHDLEGVTIDDDGVIYIVGEEPAMYVLRPIPEPSTILLLTVAGALKLTRRSRQ